MDLDKLLDPRDSRQEMMNCYKCRLTCLAAKGKGRSLARTITKMTSWFDPFQQIVNIEEDMHPKREKTISNVTRTNAKGCLVTPALSVMMYIKETGDMSVKDAEKILKRTPWKFHHRVELQNKRSPNTSLAKQEFYKLTSDLPLFAACPVLTESEHLRISMYVHNFSAMVEFYRLITDTEIETQKPEFCIFQIYQQPGLDVQLSLKHSQYIFPVPVESAYVSFNVRNIDIVKQGLQTDVNHVNGNVYTTRDPDGNLVVLYETSCDVIDSATLLASGTEYIADNSVCVDDLKSLKSTSESHDSGRYSDVECSMADATVSERKNRSIRVRGKKELSEGSDGYESSKSFGDGGHNSGNNMFKDKGKTLKNGMTVTKGNAKFDEHLKSLALTADVSKTTTFAPVYI